MRDVAVLINEFGEVGIDHLLVEKIDDDMVLLDSGCLCCTVRGDLSRALRELFMRRLNRRITVLSGARGGCCCDEDKGCSLAIKQKTPSVSRTLMVDNGGCGIVGWFVLDVGKYAARLRR